MHFLGNFNRILSLTWKLLQASFEYSIVSLLFKVLKNNDYILHKIESFYHHCHNRLRFVKEQSDQSLTHTTLYKIVHMSIYISVNLVFRISINLRNCFLLFDNKS